MREWGSERAVLSIQSIGLYERGKKFVVVIIYA